MACISDMDYFLYINAKRQPNEGWRLCRLCVLSEDIVAHVVDFRLQEDSRIWTSLDFPSG
ncbi:hypothetical protein YP72344_35990 [Yersinia pseudotuberculosis]|nr:hypothetical protein YP72344_35990 [Yersinia pseudotuberculosis]